jgi:predicted transposase YdaD
MFQDILRESWVYQEIGHEFHEKGIEEGLEQGTVKGQRHTLMSYLQTRFPEITNLANQQINSINDPKALDAVSVKLFAAQTVEEAKQILLEVNKQ